jgi:hypothetical protein
MKQSNDFAHDMIDLDTHPDRLLFLAGQDVKPMQNPDGTISIVVSLQGMRHNGTFRPIGETRQVRFTLCAYGKDILRFSGAFADEKILQDSIMLDLDPSVAPSPLVLRMPGDGLYVMEDPDGTIRARITTTSATVRHWSDLQRPGDPMIGMEFYPSGDETCPVRFMRHDHFFPGKLESAPLGCLVDKHAVSGTVFSLHSNPDAHFYGTGSVLGGLISQAGPSRWRIPTRWALQAGRRTRMSPSSSPAKDTDCSSTRQPTCVFHSPIFPIGRYRG